MPDRITATGWRNAKTRILTVDQTVRRVTLDAGRHLLFGDAAEVVRFTTRVALRDGSLGPGERAEPTVQEMAAATAGAPPAGSAWGGSATTGPPELPADPGVYRFIDVAAGHFMNLYLVANASAQPKLVGPVTWDLVDGKVVA
jgi:hypothetical protein